MKTRQLLSVLFALAASSSAFAAGVQALSPELQKLDVSAGHWVYHGQTLNTPFGKAGSWTWDEHCRWSQNREFMMCSFTNDWAGKTIKSLVVDTWDTKVKSYRHYELYSNGEEPFISKMSIKGNTRIEYATGVDHGKKYRTRITYVFDSPTQVKVKIEISRHGALWVTTDEGEGVKQP